VCLCVLDIQWRMLWSAGETELKSSTNQQPRSEVSVNSTKKTPLFWVIWRKHKLSAPQFFVNVCMEWGTEVNQLTTSGVDTGWTGVDSSTPLLPEGFPGTDAELVSFLGRGRASVKKEANLPIPMDVQAQKSFLPQALLPDPLTMGPGPRWGFQLQTPYRVSACCPPHI